MCETSAVARNVGDGRMRPHTPVHTLRHLRRRSGGGGVCTRVRAGRRSIRRQHASAAAPEPSSAGKKSGGSGGGGDRTVCTGDQTATPLQRQSFAALRSTNTPPKSLPARPSAWASSAPPPPPPPPSLAVHAHVQYSYARRPSAFSIAVAVPGRARARAPPVQPASSAVQPPSAPVSSSSTQCPSGRRRVAAASATVRVVVVFVAAAAGTDVACVSSRVAVSRAWCASSSLQAATDTVVDNMCSCRGRCQSRSPQRPLLATTVARAVFGNAATGANADVTDSRPHRRAARPGLLSCWAALRPRSSRRLGRCREHSPRRDGRFPGANPRECSDVFRRVRVLWFAYSTFFERHNRLNFTTLIIGALIPTFPSPLRIDRRAFSSAVLGLPSYFGLLSNRFFPLFDFAAAFAGRSRTSSMFPIRVDNTSISVSPPPHDSIVLSSDLYEPKK